MKKVFWLSLLVLVLTACRPQTSIRIPVPAAAPEQPLAEVNQASPEVSDPSPQFTPSQTPKPTSSVTPKPAPSQMPEEVDVPSVLNLDAPFTPQAPYAVWDDLHNEACEEASMIMADAYFDKRGLTQAEAEDEIQKQVAWQTDNGYTYDITANQVAAILDEYFSLRAEVTSEVTVDNIMYQLNTGNLIIIPAAGRRLGNPYYKQPGPLYHMLVIRGYDANKKQFITNDPGTRRGEEYRYSYDTLINAIHDWPKEGLGKDDVTDAEMEAGRKVMVIVGK